MTLEQGKKPEFEPRAHSSKFDMRSVLVLCILGFVTLACAANGCEDKRRACNLWARKGYCMGRFSRYLKKYCQKSCKHCSGGGGGGSGASNVASEQCGYKPSTRIVGGTEAPQGAWPWQAQVRTDMGDPFCGGTLVHRRWIVTAAHCTKGKSALYIRVRLGAHYKSNDVGTEQDFEVEKIINHENFRKPYGYAHDISLLKLRKPAQLNTAVKLACLPEYSRNVHSVKDGKMCWVTGFGRLFAGGDTPNVLMQVEVPVVSQTTCKRAYPSLVHDSMICAGLREGGKDACQGDSGGPMVCQFKGRFYLEGVVSWGHGCAAPGKYGVYSRVRYLREWIDSTMRKNS